MIGLFAACTSAACTRTGSQEDDNAKEVAEEVSSDVEKLVLEQCNFHYDCPAGETPFAKAVAQRNVEGPQRMARTGEQCFAEGIELLSYRRASFRDAWTEFSWKVEEDRLTFCRSEECVVCKMVDVPSVPKRCRGSSPSCLSQTVGLCKEVPGCEEWARTSTFYGTSAGCRGGSCEASTDEASCAQQGCLWR